MTDEAETGARQSQTGHWNTQNPGLGVDLVGELSGLLCWVVASSDACERWNWRVAGLGVGVFLGQVWLS